MTSLYRHCARSAMTLAMLLSMASFAAADDEAKPALLMAKALSYERRIAETKGKTVGVAVLYAADSAASKREANDWVTAFRDLGSLKVHGVSVEVWAVPYQQDRLSSFVSDHGVDVLLACEGTPFADISIVARDHKILSAGDTAASIVSSLSLGVFVEKSKPRILINMRAAKAEGAVFSAKLLQLAELL
jgi:hypothetical protein